MIHNLYEYINIHTYIYMERERGEVSHYERMVSLDFTVLMASLWPEEKLGTWKPSLYWSYCVKCCCLYFLQPSENFLHPVEGIDMPTAFYVFLFHNCFSQY